MTSDSYLPPTVVEFRTLLAALDLTGAAAAELMGLSGARVVRRFTGGEDPRPVSFSLLYVLVHRAAGIEISPDHWRDDVRSLFGSAGASSSGTAVRPERGWRGG